MDCGDAAGLGENEFRRVERIVGEGAQVSIWMTRMTRVLGFLDDCSR